MHSNLLISKRFICSTLAATLLLAGGLVGQAAAADKVLARVGNQTVTEADLDQLANAVPEKFRYLYQTPEGRQKTLDYVVNIYVLSEEAKNQGMDKKPEVQRLIDFTKKDLLARVYLDKMNKGLPAPSEQDVKTFYEKNKERFVTPESIHLRHILVKTEKEAKDALAKLKKGQKFDELAKKVSICPSKGKGGDLEWLVRGNLLKEIEDVAFSMEKGQITGPVKTKFGFHVLYLEDKKPGQESSLDQVNDFIVEQLKFQAQQKQYEKVAQDLRKKMNVQVTAPPASPVTGPATAPAGPPAGPTAGPKN